MKAEIEPMQQPVRKVVGRPLSMSRRLAHLEDWPAFSKNTRMDHSPKPREITSQFEKLLVALAADSR
jgi:hypothetical protein